MRKGRVPTAKCPHCGAPLYISENPSYVYQCPECDEDFFEIEAKYSSSKARDDALSVLWSAIEDEPFDGDREEFKTKFFGISDADSPEPMSREDVWLWFDERFSNGLGAYLYGTDC